MKYFISQIAFDATDHKLAMDIFGNKKPIKKTWKVMASSNMFVAGLSLPGQGWQLFWGDHIGCKNQENVFICFCVLYGFGSFVSGSIQNTTRIHNNRVRTDGLCGV